MAEWLSASTQIFLFFGMLFGLFGMLIPIFPGPLVIWALMLLSGLLLGFEVKGVILFTLITGLAIAGMLADNVLMVGKARQDGARWLSIFVASITGLVGSLLLTPLAGIPLTLLALYLMEYAYRKDKSEAWAVVKGMAVGWGWSFVVRFGLGVMMIALWGLWVLT